jgi:recombinational DNA repair protein (RecF pathway)
MNDLALYNLGVAFPTCAICNKPVDKVETMYHPAYQGKLFRVHCHGQYEDQMLDDMMFLGSHQVTFGKAFQKPQIEATKENK